MSSSSYFYKTEPNVEGEYTVRRQRFPKMSAVKNLSPRHQVVGESAYVDADDENDREFTERKLTQGASSGYKNRDMMVKEVNVVYKDLSCNGAYDPERFSTLPYQKSVPLDRSLLNITIDFTRPDGTRCRPLLVEGRRLFVCEQYMTVWSQVLRAYFNDAPGTAEISLPNVKYRHMKEVLECCSPMHKEIIATVPQSFQSPLNSRLMAGFLTKTEVRPMEGMLYRCEQYLLSSRLPLIERIWLADKYKLDRLLCRCLAELVPSEKMDLQGPRYHGLSDKVKVILLERLHGAKAPAEPPEPVSEIDKFARRTETNFATIAGVATRSLYVNPFFIAAWSSSIAQKLASNSSTQDFLTGCTQEELKAFLYATHPPQLRLTEENIGPVLVSACKMESEGLMRRCARFLLGPSCELSVFAKFSLVDRCFLHELLEPCLRALVTPEQALDMTLQRTYDCLSTKARAAILDRLGVLLTQPGMMPHHCTRCRANSRCPSIGWTCPHCGEYAQAEEQL